MYLCSCFGAKWVPSVRRRFAHTLGHKFWSRKFRGIGRIARVYELNPRECVQQNHVYTSVWCWSTGACHDDPVTWRHCNVETCHRLHTLYPWHFQKRCRMSTMQCWALFSGCRQPAVLSLRRGQLSESLWATLVPALQGWPLQNGLQH